MRKDSICKAGVLLSTWILMTGMAWAQENFQQDPEPLTPQTQLAQGLSGPQLDQSLTDLKATFTQIEAVKVPDFRVSSPAYTIVVPAGYGVGAGTAYVVVGGVFERRNQSGAQAGVGLGVGIGDPTTLVGVDVSYVLVDVDKGLGGFNVKVHRNLLNTTQASWSVAGGWEDFTTTGNPSRSSTAYGSTSVIFKLNPDIDATFSRLALTAGVGGGRFRTESDIQNNRDSLGVFGSAALRITQAISVIGEWTGQDLAAGVSYAPFPDINLYITPAVRDLAGPANNRVRFSLSAGLVLQF